MANLVALRDYLSDLMRNPRPGRPALTVNALFEIIQNSPAQGVPPVSRTTLYNWFRDISPGDPTSALLECIPAFSLIFGISEYELYHIAGILPPEIETAASLLAAANEFRNTLTMATRALMNAGLSSDGVAIVVDRVMNLGLDFKITIWPIVRGYTKEIHVHSWVVLEPVEPIMSRRRGSIASLTSRHISEQREHIRQYVITETLWRSLGLRWRTEPGPEWPYNNFPDLCIEIPIEERNRLPVTEIYEVPHIVPERILVLSAPFGHAELAAALIGTGLGFGTIDLRYQGFPDPRSRDAIIRFCRETIKDRVSRYAWSITETAEIIASIENEIIGAARNHLIIGISYGPLTRGLGAEIWGIRSKELLAAADVVARIIRTVNREHPVISIEYDEADYTSGTTSDRNQQVDLNLLTDHVRLSAAEVMNYVYEKCNGPPVTKWGSIFDDLIYGVDSRARIPPRGSRVRWCPPKTLQAGS